MVSLQKKVKDYLILNSVLPMEKIELIEKGSKNWEEFLATEKILNRDGILKLKSKIFGLDYYDLSSHDIDPQTLAILSPKASDNYQTVVFEKVANKIKVGMVNPDDFLAHEAIEFMAKQLNLAVEYFVISFLDFKKIINKSGDFDSEIGTAIQSAEERFGERESRVQVGVGEEKIKDAPVAKMVSVIMENAVDGGASDIHIEPGRTESRVRYRVDGVLHTSIAIPNHLHNAVVSRIKVLSNLKLDETRVPQDGRIRVGVNGKEIDLRISVLPMLDAEKVVMRILDTSAGVPTLEELGFMDYHISIINRNMNKSFGLFLLTGPTGSGKTTTLYSILNQLNNDKFNITTLEDPIEYYVNSINQSQINPDVGYSFANGLRAILRQDPNVIMVGEIRDSETAELVVHAALTGHLVFSTLHTNNAWGAIPRLIDMKVEPFLMSSILNLVMAQRLVRKICPSCKTDFTPPENLMERIKIEALSVPKGIIKDLKFYKGKGCPECANTGYSGRIVVSEIIEMNTAFKDLISKGSFNMEEVRSMLKSQNFISLMQDGIVKASLGLTTLEEVMRVSQEA